MKTLGRHTPWLILVLAGAAWAQRPAIPTLTRPRPPPAIAEPKLVQEPPDVAAVQPPPPGKVVQPSGAAPPAAPGTGASAAAGPKEKPDCETVRKHAKYNIYFDKVEIEKLVQTVSDATCRTFILPENVRGKISIIGPENGKVEVDADQFYAAFLSALDANGLALYPHGKFLKILDKRSAKQSTIPTIVDPDQDYTTNEQMVTRLFKVRNVEVEALRGVLQQLVTKDGDTIPFQPDTIIVNDLGSNMHRLQKLIEQLDRRSASDEVRVIQIRYAPVQDVADKIGKLFESKSPKPGQRPGSVPPAPGAPPTPGQPAPGGEAIGGPATLTQLIPDERTNKLIVIASPSAFERINELINTLDVPIPGEGRINVYYLENAAAEDIASTLQSLTQGSTSKAPKPPPAQPGQPKAPAQAAELFGGEVKISADKSTNSLVIVASQADFRNIVRVIEKLDIPRRQVFVEAVIMEVNLDRNSEFGVNLHSGYPLRTEQGVAPLVFGTKYAKQGLPPSFSIANLASFGGFLAGLQGPVIPELDKLGISVPAFGLVLHALQQSSDVNVLSTPHILTSDNEEAEIKVGQKVPFQAGFSPSALGSAIPGVSGAMPGGVNPALAAGLGGGLGSFFAPIQREPVELTLTVKPQINESDFIRMVISEKVDEIASQDQVLGPTTSTRSAKTTVVARDQETVVIGGMMQDRTIESVSKVPLLGDIPLLGHLFRDQSRKKIKTNLLLFLTPYIIKDQTDFRRIFERKMKERQQFVEQFYGQVPGYEVAVDFTRKAGPLARIAQTIQREEARVENGGAGTTGEKVIKPGSEEPPVPPAPSRRPLAPQPAPEGGPPVQAPEGALIPPVVEPPYGADRAGVPPEERLRLQPGPEAPR